MNLPFLAAHGPLLANAVNGRAAGMIHREHDDTWRLPQWFMHVQTHGALTLKVPYVIGFVAADPVGLTSAAATNLQAIVGIARVASLAAGWAEMHVMGLCEDAVAANAIAADNNVEVLNAGVLLTDDASTSPIKTATSLAVALELSADDTCDVMMYGCPVNIT